MNETLDVNTLENLLWEPACKISGEINTSKHKDYDDKNTDNPEMSGQIQ
jgi:hypothetical protein